MGLLDRVKEQAAAATEIAKEQAAKGQAKLDAMQAKRVADDLLHDLGVMVFAEKTGRPVPNTQTTVEGLLTALGQHEAEHGPVALIFESAAGRGPVGPS